MSIFPVDPAQLLRLRRTLAAAAGGMLLSIVAGVFLIQGHFRIGAGGFAVVNIIYWTINLGFVTAIWSGFNRRFRDRSLTIPQLLWATLCVMTAAYLSVGQQEVVLMFYFLALAFGCFRLRLRGFLLITCVAILGYGVVVILVAGIHQDTSWQHGLISWTVFSLVGLSFATVGAALSRVRADLSLRNKELAAALDRLERTKASKEAFISDLSDELAAPLQTLIESSKNMSPSSGADMLHEQLARLRNVGIRLLTLVNSMIDLAKLESGTLKLNPNPFSVRNSITRINKMFEFSAEENGVNFETSVSSDVPDRVIADAGRIEEILVSMIGHAIRSNPGCDIRLVVERQAREKQEFLRFTIVDSAGSIPTELQEEIFAASFHPESAVIHRFGGAGVGLSMCRQLMELMGGRIRIQTARGGEMQISLTIILERGPEPD